MYTEFWKLREQPFNNTPDPKYFYASEKHQEALSRLQYLVNDKKACGLLTGVYGCGKTLVMHSLKRATEAQGCKYSIVSNPRLDDTGILRFVLRGLTQQEIVPTNKADVLMQLQSNVEKIAHDGKHTVVVIDEAHAIVNEDIFEELRLLMNFQTETQHLLTLLLVGQPELGPRVEMNKQLNQRIAIRYHLDAFSLADTAKYIRHRMLVGGVADEVFSPEAVDSIQKQSGGIPRWINHFAHMSLLTAFSKGLHRITSEIVDEAAKSISGAS